MTDTIQLLELAIKGVTSQKETNTKTSAVVTTTILLLQALVIDAIDHTGTNLVLLSIYFAIFVGNKDILHLVVELRKLKTGILLILHLEHLLDIHLHVLLEVPATGNPGAPPEILLELQLVLLQGAHPYLLTGRNLMNNQPTELMPSVMAQEVTKLLRLMLSYMARKATKLHSSSAAHLIQGQQDP